MGSQELVVYLNYPQLHWRQQTHSILFFRVLVINFPCVWCSLMGFKCLSRYPHFYYKRTSYNCNENHPYNSCNGNSYNYILKLGSLYYSLFWNDSPSQVEAINQMHPGFLMCRSSISHEYGLVQTDYVEWNAPFLSYIRGNVFDCRICVFFWQLQSI